MKSNPKKSLEQLVFERIKEKVISVCKERYQKAVKYSEGKGRGSLQSLNGRRGTHKDTFFETGNTDGEGNNREMFLFINKFLEMLYEELILELKKGQRFIEGTEITLDTDPVTGYNFICFVTPGDQNYIGALSNSFWRAVLGRSNSIGVFFFGQPTITDKALMRQAKVQIISNIQSFKIDYNKIPFEDVIRIANETFDMNTIQDIISREDINECTTGDEIEKAFYAQWGYLYEFKQRVLNDEKYLGEIQLEHFEDGIKYTDRKIYEKFKINYFAPHLEKISYENQAANIHLGRLFHEFKDMTKQNGQNESLNILKKRIKTWLNTRSIEMVFKRGVGRSDLDMEEKFILSERGLAVVKKGYMEDFISLSITFRGHIFMKTLFEKKTIRNLVEEHLSDIALEKTIANIRLIVINEYSHPY